ncbi:MAG: aminodeoxychorismate lyase [Paenisporosarcina sp.]
MWAWMNGEFIKAEDLRISPFDHGFLYGLGFFETFRTYEGKIFLADMHLERLKQALDEFHLRVELDVELIYEIVQKLNHRADGEDGYFRLNVSAGAHDIGLQPTEYQQPTVILFRKPLPISVRGREKTAVWLETRRNSPESITRHKSHHYANNVRARLELPSLAVHEGFFLTQSGHIAEGITSNIFWVREGALFTPSLDTGILAGITRSWIIESARSLGLEVIEGLFLPEELLQASEVFITNAVQEIVPIKTLESTTFAGNKGSIYNRLHRRYVQQVNEIE